MGEISLRDDFDMIRYYFVFVAIIYLLVSTAYVHADLYFWTDEYGKEHLTNEMPPEDAKIIRHVDDRSEEQYKKEFIPYFPEGTLGENQRSHNDYNHWFSKYLSRMQEPVLWKSNAEKEEIYRFLWLRTFQSPVCIRINISSYSSATLTTKVTNGAGGYLPGELIQNSTVRLSENQKSKFLDTVNKNRFWTLKNGKRSGLDGSEWVIEGLKNDEYHVTHIWSPEPNDNIREIGILMLQLSKYADGDALQ